MSETDVDVYEITSRASHLAGLVRSPDKVQTLEALLGIADTLCCMTKNFFFPRSTGRLFNGYSNWLGRGYKKGEIKKYKNIGVLISYLWSLQVICVVLFYRHLEDVYECHDCNQCQQMKHSMSSVGTTDYE